MVKIVPTPDWFLGKDVLIQIFSLIVLLIFCILAFRNYQLNREKRTFFYLAAGFGLVALAQLASILTKLVLYYDFGPTQQIGSAIVASQALSSVDIFYYMGFFFQKFLTLLGFYIIYRLPREKKFLGDYFLVAYFVIISALISTEVIYLYHISALFILVLISSNYYDIYRKNSFFNTKILMIAFSVLAFSQLMLLFSVFAPGISYVVGNLIELIGYTILLGLIIRIRKHGKKKKPHGHHIGHVGNNPRKRR